MVNIWLLVILWLIVMLVGGAITILKNDGVRQWGWDDIPYMKWNIIQPCLKPPTSYSYIMEYPFSLSIIIHYKL